MGRNWAERCVQVLRDPALDAIDFCIGLTNRLQVDGAGLRIVAGHIERGDIRVVPDNNDDIHGGRYFSRENRMHLRTAIDDIGPILLDGLIVHEAVHALMDVRAKRVLSLRNEAAAYTAQAIFLAKNTYLDGAIKREKTEKTRAIMRAAQAVVERHKLLTRKGVRLSRTDVLPLIEAIEVHPAYDDHKRSSRGLEDGI